MTGSRHPKGRRGGSSETAAINEIGTCLAMRHATSVHSALAPDLLGSGTVFEIGDSWFVFTAAHVTEQSPKVACPGWFVPERDYVGDTDVLASDDYRLDFAVIKMPRVKGKCRIQPVTLREIHIPSEKERDGLFILTGYPIVRSKFDERANSLEQVATGYALTMLDNPPKQLTVSVKAPIDPYSPSMALDDNRVIKTYPTNEHRDLFLSLSESGLYDSLTGEGCEAEPMNGFSGGGVWFLPNPRTPTIDSCRYAGLAVSGSPDGRWTWIHAIRIAAMLRWLYKKFPETRGELEAIGFNLESNT